MAVDKLNLSGSTNGRGILVAVKDPTAGAGTLIHTGPSVSSSYDEVWIYANNTSTNTNRKIVLQWGGITNPNDFYEYTRVFGESGLHVIASGLILRGNATPLEIRAACDPINVINIFGYVNRIS
jgi:hypothetical protein